MKSHLLQLLLLTIFSLQNSVIVINCNDITTTLKQLHVLFRHGERSPTETYPTDPHINYKWPLGWGHLSNEGKAQMYLYGQTLKGFYPNFFPKYYWPEDVNFTSSYSERCLMSAELVAAGLFPPKDEQVWNSDLLWQPVPIHYLPRSMDNTIAMKSACEKYDQMFMEVKNSSKIRKVNSDNQDLYTYLTEHTGMLVDNIETVEQLFNTLEIENVNNLTLPFWVNDTILNKMKELAALNLAIYSETEYMQRMKGGMFLKTIITLMKESNSSRKVPSINMYSGHDITIVHVLRALKLVETVKPGFGASLIFEIHTNSEIKMFYRHTWDTSPEEKVLETCKTPCLLSEFELAIDDVLPKNWEEECKMNQL